MDEAWVAEKYGIEGSQYAEFATMRGDTSDGLPGIKGVGDKTAAQLLKDYGSLAGVIAAAEDPVSGMRPPLRAKIMAALDYLIVAPKVVAVAQDVPIPDGFDDKLPPSAVDPDRVDALAEKWGIETSVRRVTDALALR